MINNNDDYIYAKLNINNTLKVNNKKYLKNENWYDIWCYDKKYLCIDENKDVLNCRSVIKSNNNNILSFSHGKSMNQKSFCEKYQLNEDIYINEYIDGTLIHLFYDDRINSWEIATKNAIGGDYTLYNKRKTKKKKTVKQMFLEALTRNNDENNINNNIIINFAKNYCYNFVLLHPENEIIFTIDSPRLYLTSVFKTSKSINDSVINIPPSIFESWDFFQNTTIIFPSKKEFSNWNQLKSKEFEIFNTKKEICGYHAIHLPSGDRCIFYNPIYKDLLRYKTLNPKQMFHYLNLHRMNLIKEFLVLFPKFRKKFNLYKDHLHQYIENLHGAYLAKYVFKTSQIIHTKYVPYVDLIHREIYVPSLNFKNKEKITKKIVYYYIMYKTPPEILYMLFHEKRQLNV